MIDWAVLSRAYPFWLCDIWGVLHAGGRMHEKALRVLRNHRELGGRVVLISNSPQPSAIVMAGLAHKGLLRSDYDGLITSGDMALRMVAGRAGQKYYFIGDEAYDSGLLAKISLGRCESPQEADFILCTGLQDGLGDDIEAHAPLLRQCTDLGLEMICANPDRLVRVGSHLIYCAGALADLYQGLGGRVRMTGKPELEIYRDGLRLLGCGLREKVLAIGDGLQTDAAGAQKAGLAFAFVESGIHAGEFADFAAIKAHIATTLPELHLVHVLADFG